ncbi:MAG: galactose-1-phosphate uridylyltransferase [Candidatus Aureabacteria bacterium]|nr:galactose-1-phosphate uridylyltransferase [Candidatus Auribacterota bacterium]
MPELRKDPILGRWVIISTERAQRPKDFFTSPEKSDAKNCPFCGGREGMTPPEIFAVRSNGSRPNSPGWEVRVVPNKFPALRIEGDLDKQGRGVYDRMNGIGAHEVIIETPDHTTCIEMQSRESVAQILEVYKLRLLDLSRDMRFKYILIFRNEGRAAGASLSHPHSQLIATPVTPKRVKEELTGAMEYFNYKDRCIYCDILRQEMEEHTRIVYENEQFVSFCPFASRFPFEIWVLPKKHHVDFHNFPSNEFPILADMMIVTLRKLGKALGHPQYNYILHTGPLRRPRKGYWTTIEQDFHWHIEIMPRLTQIAGFEWGTGFYINPTAPEEAAKYLRQVDL